MIIAFITLLREEYARDFLKVQIKGPPSLAIDWFCNNVPMNPFYVSPPCSAWACFTFPHHSVLQLYCYPDAHHTHEAVKPQAVHEYSNTNTWIQTQRYNVCIHSNTLIQRAAHICAPHLWSCKVSNIGRLMASGLAHCSKAEITSEHENSYLGWFVCSYICKFVIDKEKIKSTFQLHVFKERRAHETWWLNNFYFCKLSFQTRGTFPLNRWLAVLNVHTTEKCIIGEVIVKQWLCGYI